MDNLKVWITHYTKLNKRKSEVIKQLDERSLKYEFIENYDREVLTDEHFKLFNLKILGKARISLLFKHIEAWYKIVDSPFDYNLIFEDDVILHKDFNNKLQLAINELPENYDLVFIGDGCGYHIFPRSRIKPNKLIYEKARTYQRGEGHGGTRCADSYLVSKKCAKIISDHITNMKKNNKTSRVAVDFLLNELIVQYKLNVFWMEPTIVTQGSQNGKFVSSI